MKRTCLLVEDDSAHRLLIRECLESLSFQVEEVVDVHEANDRLRTRRFGLLVLDVDLPDGTGFDIQSRFSQPNSSPAIIFVTSDDLAESAVSAMRAGAENYIVKRPDYLEELRAAVRQLLASDPLSDREEFDRRERDRLLAALEANRWNVSATSRSLGMSRGKLRGRMRALGLD